MSFYSSSITWTGWSVVNLYVPNLLSVTILSSLKLSRYLHIDCPHLFCSILVCCVNMADLSSWTAAFFWLLGSWRVNMEAFAPRGNGSLWQQQSASGKEFYLLQEHRLNSCSFWDDLLALCCAAFWMQVVYAGIKANCWWTWPWKGDYVVYLVSGFPNHLLV